MESTVGGALAVRGCYCRLSLADLALTEVGVSFTREQWSRLGQADVTIECWRIPAERVRHWRGRHREVTEIAERTALPRALLHPAAVTRDPKAGSVERRYAQDDMAKWWRVVVMLPGDVTPFVLTFHRVQKVGR